MPLKRTFCNSNVSNLVQFFLPTLYTGWLDLYEFIQPAIIILPLPTININTFFLFFLAVNCAYYYFSLAASLEVMSPGTGPDQRRVRLKDNLVEQQRDY